MNTRQEIKAISKEQLNRNGNWKLPALITGISLLVSLYGQRQSDGSIMIWVTSLISAFIGVYTSMLYLNIAKSSEDDSATFEYLKVEPSKLIKCILYSIVVSLITFGATFGAVLVSSFIMTLVPILGVVLALLTLFIGGLISIYATFSVYLILDKDCGVFEALKLSIRLVKGSFFKIIVMGLSFILWIIFSGLTFGIGALWVTPYIGITFANYYLKLYKEKIENKSI
ncbi:DUF975 family protein [Romboutsia weinsteinii]|nr:DUF975 family protein [Romboutsia weinsteinii]